VRNCDKTLASGVGRSFVYTQPDLLAVADSRADPEIRAQGVRAALDRVVGGSNLRISVGL
jgi:hypothetical protein